MVCNPVLHLIARDFLRDASRLTRKHRAPGGAQGTATPDAEPVADHRRDRQARWRDHRDVAPPVERGWREKAGGQKRPRGTPCFEATMVPRAVGMLLAASVEQACQAFSHGVRKGPSPQQARHELREQWRTLPRNGRGDAEVRGCCDNGAGGLLREWSQPRGKAGGRLRRSGQGLHASVLEAGERPPPDQASALS
jgi:hypothetical protein